MAHYFAVKETTDSLLLVKLGDFYEAFGDDAAKMAKTLNMALTKRNGVMMCGIPSHALDRYTAQLVNAGHFVMICPPVAS
jgi:DNA mismatch repair protein MutS